MLSDIAELHQAQVRVHYYTILVLSDQISLLQRKNMLFWSQQRICSLTVSERVLCQFYEEIFLWFLVAQGR